MLYIFLLVLIGVIFRTWLTFDPISSGDMGFFHKEQILNYFNPPFMWETFRNTGFGGNSFLFQGVYFYNIPLGFLGRFLDYGVIERIIWFYPILIIGSFSPLVLVGKLNLFPSRYYPITVSIYLLNTYFFMVMGGGQLTVVLGYITIPIALALFIDILKKTTVLKIILFSFIAALLVAFDFRYAYIFFAIIFAYTVFLCFQLTSLTEYIALGKKYILLFFIPFFITVSIHAFWLLPFSLNLQNPSSGLTETNISNDAVKYFSFATLENAFSMLHPLWPENIFGKVGFMKPEFIILPILAYSSLFFISSKFKVKSSKSQLKVQNFRSNLIIEQPARLASESVAGRFNNQIITFFALLGLVGVFLAKGAKEPFGEIYIWLFENIPGFVMFRDPTKWYTLTALSYSILIPYSIYKIFELLRYHWGKSKIKNQKSKIQFKIQKYLPNLFLIFTVLYIVFLIKPAIVGEVGGTLKTVIAPQEYVKLKNFLLSKNDFSRVLWVPTLQRFTFYSNTHPAISGKDFFDTSEPYGVITALQKEDAKELLQELGVKYVIVPDDTQKEIFIKDRKFDPVQYNVTLEKLKRIPYLKEVNKFGKVAVFEIDNSKDHFWSNSDNLKITNEFINPTEYNVRVENAKKTDRVIFVESFDKNWVAKIDNNLINSESYNKSFNSFVLPKGGNYSFEVYYKPQELVKTGLIISLFTFSSILFLMIFLLIRGKIARKL